MVTQKGISYVEIMDGGLGYTNTSTVLITDSSGFGAQASVSVNAYGEISAINIDNPGEGMWMQTLPLFLILFFLPH